MDKMPLLEEVKSLITSILNSNQNPLTISKLDRDYLKQTGTKIPYRSLGYATLQEFLDSISDVLAISPSRGKMRLSAKINPKVAHTYKQIRMQRQQSEQDFNKNNLHGSTDFYADCPENNNEWSKESYLSYYTNISTDNSTKLPSINDLEQPSSSKLNHHAEELCAENGAYQNSKAGCVPAAVQNNLRIIINRFKNGLIYTQLPVAYKCWFDKELDFREFNYDSLLEMCRDLQNVVLLTYKEEIMLFDQNEPLPKNVRKHLRLLKSSRKEKSSSLSQLLPGNRTSNTKHAERTNSSVPMNLLDVKQSTVLSSTSPDFQPASSRMPATLTPSTNLSMLPSDLSQSKCSHESAPLNQSTSSCNESKQLAHSTKPANCSSQTSDKDQIEYPANVIKLSEEISREFVTLTDQFHQTFSVHVTEIYDPSKFWIILYKNGRSFNDLHRKMQLWSKYRKNFKIPVNFLRCGLHCAFLHKNEYYRGMVVKLSLSCDLAKVYFIDFGTVATIDSNELYFLHNDFIKFPQQAIRARLAGIQPADANSSWSEDASKYFVSQVFEKTVEASIFRINEESQSVELILEDKNMSTCINDNLVKAGHAVFDYENQKEKPFTNIASVVNFIHLYPTFDEIEKGAVLTAEDPFEKKKSGHFNKDDLNVSIYKNETGQSSNNIQNLRKHEKVEKQNQAECLSDPAKCRLRLTKIIFSENQLHDKQLINNTLTNLFKPTDLNNFLECPTNITGYYSVDILNDFSLSQNMQINNWHLNTPNTNCLNNLGNFKVKEKLKSFILQSLDSGNTTSLFYINRLLHELQPLTYSMQNAYNILKDQYMSLPPHILQFFINMLLNYFDSGKLLELYTFVYHVCSPSANDQSLIGIDGTNRNEIITRTDFSGCPIYLYHVHNQVYVDMREMLQLTNLNELPLHRITNETDMENFIGSLLITSLIEHPKLIQELARNKISFCDKLVLIKVQFIPKFYEAFANEELPKNLFGEFLKKINF